MLFEMLVKKLVIFGRKHLSKPVSRDFFCQGRPWLVPTFSPIVPVKGRGAVNRRLWSKRLTPVCISKERLKNGNTFHSSGWRDGISWVDLGEQTACCDYSCACMVGGQTVGTTLRSVEKLKLTR